MGVLDEYVDALDEPARTAYLRVLEPALAEAPDAGHGMSYGMAA